MALSLITKALVCIILCTPGVLSVPGIGSRALERRLLPINDSGTCLPPSVACDRACCGVNSVCGTNGLCKVKPPPPPPIPGQISLKYSNDNLGRPTVINIIGQGFNTTVDLEIQMVVGTQITTVWAHEHDPSHAFLIETGWQDCSKTNERTTVKEGGYPATVYAWDNSWVTYVGLYQHTSAIPVRVTANGICP